MVNNHKSLHNVYQADFLHHYFMQVSSRWEEDDDETAPAIH